jgi:hypothetical protein
LRFSHLVEMRRKYAKQGLVVMSVSIEEGRQDKKEHQDRVLAFLKQQEKDAPFANYILDEPIDVWADKLGAANRPIVFVFNRDGRWKRFEAPDEEGDRQMTKLIEDWLKKK